jgi:hypothetical protein
MKQNNRVTPSASALAPDMGLELMHWRSSYPHAPCFKSGLCFERYAATFKFGYDTFLLNHMKSEDELFPLCHQYKDGVAACDRIDWLEARMIVAATWERLRLIYTPQDTAPIAFGNDRLPRRDSASSRSSGHQWKWFFSRPSDLHASSTAPRQAVAV